MNIPRYSLRQLAYFVAVAESGTIKGAVERLFVSSSSISEAISELERELGVQLLLRRKAHGIALTQAGSEVLAAARKLLAEAGELQFSARGLGEALTGRIVIGCFSTMAALLLPRLIDEFQARHPAVEVDIIDGTQAEVQHALDKGQCELAILYDDADLLPRLTREVLFHASPHVVLRAGHPLAKRAAVKLRDLADEPVIVVDIPPSLYYTRQIFEAAKIAPQIRFRTGNFELARALVGRGLGYAVLLTRPPVNLSYEGREIVTRPIENNSVKVAVVLSRVADAKPSRRAEALAQFCRELFAPGA